MNLLWRQPCRDYFVMPGCDEQLVLQARNAEAIRSMLRELFDMVQRHRTRKKTARFPGSPELTLLFFDGRLLIRLAACAALNRSITGGGG
ncbi:hypothetical protein ACFQ88_26030 [Paenibacillus sp. NPDC056579]|uniref:hypothetical protein n=1 Tax=Paenibacillus sp. NPDC056579 TaxID=3345871 RepID=UPI0036983A64